jgi:ribosomal protein S18 acetylase RimI-like enzyme
MRKQGESPTRANSSHRPSFRVVPVKRSEHLFFNLCDFDFFRKSTGGDYLFFGNPRLLAPVVAVPYVLSCEIIFFGKKRFFVKLRERVAGIFVVREKVESLYINSLAVAPEYRRSGLGRSILDFAAKLGKRLGKKWLELSVLKTNGPAIRLYAKAGFSMFEERKRSLTLRRRLV